MNHHTVLLLISAIWVALELIVGLVSRGSGGRSVLDRGSHTLLWVLLFASIFTAGFINQLPLTQIPNLF